MCSLVLEEERDSGRYVPVARSYAKLTQLGIPLQLILWDSSPLDFSDGFTLLFFGERTTVLGTTHYSCW